MCSFSKEVKEEVIKMREDIERMKEESFAYELVKDQRRQNKRLFVIWIITFLAFCCLLTYTIWLLNDVERIVETENETFDVQQDSGDGGNNNFINGSYNEVNNG